MTKLIYTDDEQEALDAIKQGAQDRAKKKAKEPPKLLAYESAATTVHDAIIEGRVRLVMPFTSKDGALIDLEMKAKKERVDRDLHTEYYNVMWAEESLASAERNGMEGLADFWGQDARAHKLLAPAAYSRLYRCLSSLNNTNKTMTKSAQKVLKPYYDLFKERPLSL